MAATNKNQILKLALCLSVFSACTLSVESFLGLLGKSLCKTEACEIVGHTLRINETMLVALGASFFWLLSLALFFLRRYPRHLHQLPLLILLPAIAFDGALIGYQIFSIQQKCILCLAVATMLLLTAITYCLSQKSYAIAVCCFLSWIGGFSANGIVQMPEPTGSRTEMIFFRHVPLLKQMPSETEITIIFSMNCPHCLDIITFLSENKLPKNIVWSFAATDQDADSLQKLAYFVEVSKNTDNPFRLIKEAKLSVSTYTYDIEKLRHQTKKALTFLANSGYTSVPLIIVKESPTEGKLFLGAASIMKYLETLF